MNVQVWIRTASLAFALAFPGVLFAGTAPVSAGACRVVIIGGLPGTPVHARRFTDWCDRFRAYCTGKLGLPAAQVTTVNATTKGVSSVEVLEAITRTGAASDPADQFILFIVGHGDIADGDATLAMPGRDVRAGDLKTALAAVRAGSQIVIHAGAASGDMLASLAATNRIVMTGTSPGEQADPVFAEFFLQALERADRPPALLDVFNAASLETARWIRRLSQTETAWRAEGKETIRLFKKLSGGPQGMAGARSLDPASRAVEPDPDIPLLAPAAGQPSVPERTRVITEHAMLEDAGRDTGLAAIGSQGYVPLKAERAGETGFRAALTRIGDATRVP